MLTIYSFTVELQSLLCRTSSWFLLIPKPLKLRGSWGNICFSHCNWARRLVWWALDVHFSPDNCRIFCPAQLSWKLSGCALPRCGLHVPSFSGQLLPKWKHVDSKSVPSFLSNIFLFGVRAGVSSSNLKDTPNNEITVPAMADTPGLV